MNLTMAQSKTRTLAALVACWLGVQPLCASGADSLTYCNAVQNRYGFIRYPLGTVGAWSTGSGEFADAMTRVPRLYPCLGSVVAKDAKDDWRSTITGDPSMLMVQYRTNKPSGATTVAVTVSPHVTVFKVTFPETPRTRYLVFDFTKMGVDTWARLNKWTERSVRRVDNRTWQATVGETGKGHAYYTIRFSTPCAEAGEFAGASSSTNRTSGGVGMFARFDAQTVTVAVAESFTSQARADEYLAAEFSTFDAVRERARDAWLKVLDRVEIDGSEQVKRMAYSALYSIYANIIDGRDGSCYREFYPTPRSIASSVYWQFIGGFQSCCWDNVRATYPFLMVAYPEVMSDVVNTYLARYQRDGVVDGNICLFTGPVGEHLNVKLSPLLIAQAQASGIRADYGKLYAALKHNFDNPACVPASLAALGYVTQPATGGRACSDTLEFSTGAHALAVLAKANQDLDGVRKYLQQSRAYANLWDRTNQVFRVRNAAGGWGPINNTNWTWNPNPQGLFEGSSKDWSFSIPHDPYGLMELPGQERFAERAAAYCLTDAWFNDYQYAYPYLLYYAGAPHEAQRIIRTSWVPLFEKGVMYEGVRPRPPHNGWQDHYSSVAGWLLGSMVALYPAPTPPGQFIISSPSVTKAVIRNGAKRITVETKNHTAENIYVHRIELDGKDYPAYMIPARRLAAGASLVLTMGNDATHALGDLYIASSDGFVGEAELPSPTRLRGVIEAAVTEARTKVFSRARPIAVRVNGLPASDWGYDETAKTLSLRTSGRATFEVDLR